MKQAMKKSLVHTVDNETQIRELIDEWVKAVRKKDLETVMRHYSPDLRAFDAIPPLESDNETYRTNWKMCFDMAEGDIGFEMRDVQVAASDDIAFAHCLNRFNATMKDGAKMDLWMRATVCYRKIDDKWLVMHEHISAPFDPKTDKAALDLKP